MRSELWAAVHHGDPNASSYIAAAAELTGIYNVTGSFHSVHKESNCKDSILRDFPESLASGHRNPLLGTATASLRLCRTAHRLRRVCDLDILVAGHLWGSCGCELRPASTQQHGGLVKRWPGHEPHPWASLVGLLLHRLRHRRPVRLLHPADAGASTSRDALGVSADPADRAAGADRALTGGTRVTYTILGSLL